MKSENEVQNYFMKWIYGKPSNGFFSKIIHKIKFILFLDQLKTVSPNYNMLWHIADFIKLLEIVYLYQNGRPNDIYSSKHKNGDNGFTILKNNHEITFTLIDRGDQPGLIKIEIFAPSGKSRSSICFEDRDSSVIETIHDEHLFINISNWVMEAVSNLLIVYYKRA